MNFAAPFSASLLRTYHVRYTQRVIRAYKYKVRRPPERIVRTFEQWLDVCRDLYNAGLQERRDAWSLQRKSVSFADQCAELTDVRSSDPEVAAVYAQVAQDALRRLNKSFLAFFARCRRGETPGFPRFRSRPRHYSFTYPQSGFRLAGDKLHLAKIGGVRLRLSRPVEGVVKTCTVKREASGWYVILTAEVEPKPMPPCPAVVGV